jgi:phosphoserine phosphatase RsbU/P
MSHLSAMFRMLVDTRLPLDQLMERASRLFCESTLPSHYATLVAMCASPSGEIEVCNAGHPPPLIVGRNRIAEVGATGLPIGLFCTEQFAIERVRLNDGDTLLLYTDGFLEAQNGNEEEFGLHGVHAAAAAGVDLTSQGMVDACLKVSADFRGARQYLDDVTIMAVRRGH